MNQGPAEQLATGTAMSRAVTARTGKDSARSPVLYLAFELGRKQWQLGFTTGMAQQPRERTVSARDLIAAEAEIDRARARFGLAARAEVVSCYEAGRDGFWLHRFLESIGQTNYVVDSSSVEVKRRAKRAKTDRLDLRALLRLLIRYQSGEHRVWSVVNAPSPEAEDARQLHRELLALRRDRTRTINRMKGLMATQGIDLELKPGFRTRGNADGGLTCGHRDWSPRTTRSISEWQPRSWIGSLRLSGAGVRQTDCGTSPSRPIRGRVASHRVRANRL